MILNYTKKKPIDPRNINKHSWQLVIIIPLLHCISLEGRNLKVDACTLKKIIQLDYEVKMSKKSFKKTPKTNNKKEKKCVG